MASLRWYIVLCLMPVFIEARNYEWLPYHAVPARNDHKEHVQKWREAIHNSVPIKMRRKDKTRKNGGKPFITVGAILAPLPKVIQ
jgi:hypothetical protein